MTRIRNHVHRSLNRVPTVLGAERRLFLLGAGVGAAGFNFTSSLIAGLLLFLPVYLLGRWAAGSDPKALQVVLASGRLEAVYDPFLYREPPR